MTKRIKQSLTLLASLSLLLSLSACPSEQTENTQSSQQSTEKPAETTEAKPAAESAHADEHAAKPAEKAADTASHDAPHADKPAENADAKADKPADAAEVKTVAVGDASQGPAVFMKATCQACHKISSLEGAVGAIGPALDGIGERASTRVEGMTAEAYIRQSIEEPNAHVVEGYAQGLMPAGLHKSLSKEEYDNLTAYLLSLKS